MGTDFKNNPGPIKPLSDDEFESIYRNHWKALFEFALAKTHNRDVAEEIVQDLFASLWEKKDSLKVNNLKSYLFISVRNRVIDHYKERLFTDLETIAEPVAPDYPLFLDELEGQLQHAVAQLPHKTQEIFLLNRWEGKSAPEIATFLNLPVRTVEYHITQALRQLRQAFQHGVLVLFSFLSTGTF